MWKRGWRSLSTTTTSRPRSASSAPMVDPAGPQPITNTSQRRSSGVVAAISSLGIGDLPGRVHAMPPFTPITWPEM